MEKKISKTDEYAK